MTAVSANYTGTNTTTLISRSSKFLERIIDPLGWGIFPSSANQSEVPAEVQNSTNGIWNITGNATYDDFTVFFKQDEAIHSSMNITFSNTSNSSQGYNISTAFQPILYNITRNQGYGVWTWGYFNNSPPGVYLPNITYRAVCKECLRGVNSPRFARTIILRRI